MAGDSRALNDNQTTMFDTGPRFKASRDGMEPSALAEKWQTEPGQLWTAGQHRILCGKSDRADAVEMAPEFVAVCLERLHRMGLKPALETA